MLSVRFTESGLVLDEVHGGVVLLLDEWLGAWSVVDTGGVTVWSGCGGGILRLEQMWKDQGLRLVD